MKYDEELTLINELAMFRLTMPALKVISGDQLFLNHELLIFTTRAEKSPDKKEDIYTTGFFMVHEGQFLIRRLRNGLCDYFMILTGEKYFGTIECMLHSAILDYRFTHESLASWMQDKYSRASHHKDFQSLFKEVTKNCKLNFWRFIDSSR